MGNSKNQTVTHELDDTSPFGRGKHVDLFWSHGDHTHYHGLSGIYENFNKIKIKIVWQDHDGSAQDLLRRSQNIQAMNINITFCSSGIDESASGKPTLFICGATGGGVPNPLGPAY